MKRLIMFLFIALLTADCSKNATTTSAAPFSSAFAAVGLSSPTAQATSAFANRGGTTSISSLSTVKASLQAAFDQAAVTDCVKNSFSFTAPIPVISTCYGPQLDYQNHPNGADGSNCASGFPCYPISQLGIWTPSASSGEACSATKANATVQIAADITNAALRSVVGLLCAARRLGLSQPSAGGASLDLTATLNEFVSNGTFSDASITQLPARTGAVSTWQTRVLGTVGSETIELNLMHSPTTADNSTFAGHFFGAIGDGSDNFAFSLTYQQTATTLVVLSKFGLPSALTADPFDINNDLDFNHALLNGQPVTYVLESVSPKSGLGTAAISWMENNQEAYARTFQLVTTAGLSADAGIAYFGFSVPLTTTANRAQISKMICNWGGPGADNSGLSGQAEAQHFTRNTNGLFVADQSAITFAPTNSCSYTPGTLKLAVTPDPPAAAGAIAPSLAHFNGATGAGDYGNLTPLVEPTY